MLPIHPHDQFLPGVQWEGIVYTDRVLPFGLCSAPKIFSAVADTLHWILVQKGINNLLHYLDDFIFIAKSLDEAKKNMQVIVTTFASLGVPLETSKLEGPAHCLTFLGIELDTATLQLRLPNDKLQCLKEALASAGSKKMYVQTEFPKPHGSPTARCQGGKAWETILTQAICSSASGYPSFSSHYAECSSPAGGMSSLTSGTAYR